MADSSGDDDNYVALVSNPNICCCGANEKEEEQSSKTLSHAVDIRAAKRTRILLPVDERIGTWGL